MRRLTILVAFLSVALIAEAQTNKSILRRKIKAASGLPHAVFTTSFNCDTTNQLAGPSSQITGCTDLVAGTSLWMRSTCSPTCDTYGADSNGSELYATANFANGSGGKGFRLWRLNGNDIESASINLQGIVNLSEMWVRWYMRYESGFAWNPAGSPSFTKDLYILLDTGHWFTMGFHSGGWGLADVTSAQNYFGNPGWTGVMGGNTSDGSWHCYEFHIQRGSGANGVVQVWTDNAVVVDVSNADLGSSGFFTDGDFAFGENQDNPNNTYSGTRGFFTDYDQIYVSDTARIGCTFGVGPQ
jgi:hypothetical protein